MASKRYSFEADSGANISTALGISEHTVVRVTAGEVETLRVRLADALEQLGYRVLDENPLRAKHGARGAASYYFSANALDYPTTLEIALKQQGKGSARVTFDYRVIHGHYGKGDRQSLTREAEAIIALADRLSAKVSCPVCNADVLSDLRFCRKCGAPITSAVPPELEVLRLTANVRAGHQWTAIGAVILAASTILPLVTLLAIDFAANPKGAKALLTLALLLAGLGWWATLGGIWKTHRTLNPRDSRNDEENPPPRRQFAAPDINELPETPSQEGRLITEGTTNLLHEVSRPEREPVPIYRAEEKNKK